MRFASSATVKIDVHVTFNRKRIGLFTAVHLQGAIVMLMNVYFFARHAMCCAFLTRSIVVGGIDCLR
jgi:hypothetical protein